MYRTYGTESLPERWELAMLSLVQETHMKNWMVQRGIGE